MQHNHPSVLLRVWLQVRAVNCNKTLTKYVGFGSFSRIGRLLGLMQTFPFCYAYLPATLYVPITRNFIRALTQGPVPNSNTQFYSPSWYNIFSSSDLREAWSPSAPLFFTQRYANLRLALPSPCNAVQVSQKIQLHASFLLLGLLLCCVVVCFDLVSFLSFFFWIVMFSNALHNGMSTRLVLCL